MIESIKMIEIAVTCPMLDRDIHPWAMDQMDEIIARGMLSLQRQLEIINLKMRVDLRNERNKID